MAIKKKRWFEVEVPLTNEQVHLLGYEIQELQNRVISLDLTRMLRGKSIELQLKVHVKDNKATTEPKQLNLLPYFLHRTIRKGTSIIEDSFSVECQNAKVRIKFFLIARKKVSRAVRNALRKKAAEEFKNWAKEKTVEELFDDVIRNKIQRPISLLLKKIYPLSLCEIRMITLESPITQSTKKKEAKEEISEKKKAKKSKESPPADVIAEEVAKKVEVKEAKDWSEGEEITEERKELEEAAMIEKKKK